MEDVGRRVKLSLDTFDDFARERFKHEGAVFVHSFDELLELADSVGLIVQDNEPLRGYRLCEPDSDKSTKAFVAPLLVPERQCIVYDPNQVGA